MRTLKQVLKELEAGLRDGSIVLDDSEPSRPRREAYPPPPADPRLTVGPRIVDPRIEGGGPEINAIWVMGIILVIAAALFAAASLPR